MANFIADLLSSVSGMSPSFMQAQQGSPNAMGDPVFGPGWKGWMPSTGQGPSMADIQNQANANAGIAPGGSRRSSLVNVIGGLADTFAELGGSKPMYQPTIDAETERQRQAESDQMTRELFPIKKQGAELDNQLTQLKSADARTELFARAYSGLESIRQRFGDDGFRAAIPNVGRIFGLSPEDQAFVANNPDQAMMLLKGLAESSSGDEFGTTVYYDRDDKGNLYPYQVSKGGGKKYLSQDPGRTAAPAMQFLDTGLGYTPGNRYTGGAGAEPINKTGDLSQGITLTPGANGAPPVAAPLEGGKQDIEFNEKVTDLRNLDGALGAMSDMFPSMLGNIEAMARAGSLSGVPEDKLGSDGKPLKGGGTLGAMAYQNIPLLEQATNEAGYSARQKIESQGMAAINTIEPLLRRAQDGNAQLSSRMMDTPKELENLLKQAVNTKDYGAAMDAYNRFKARYDEVRKDIQGRIERAEGKTAAGRKANAAPTNGGWLIEEIR